MIFTFSSDYIQQLANFQCSISIMCSDKPLPKYANVRVQCTDIDKNQQKYYMNKNERKGRKVIKKRDKKVVRSDRKFRVGLVY